MQRNAKEKVELLEQRKVSSNRVIDTDSLVSKYEVLIKENEAKPMSEERSHLLFNVLDNVLPHFGVFKPLLTIIRNELYEYVFSSDIHTVKSQDGLTQRVPYHLLMKTVHKTRDERYEELQENIDRLQEALFKKQTQFEELAAKLNEKENECSELKNSTFELQSQLSKYDRDNQKLSESLEESKKLLEQTTRNLNGRISGLQLDCADKDSEIHHLSAFKKGYDSLHDAFADPSSLLDDGIKKVQVIASKQEHLKSNICTAKKLEEQILKAMNTIIEQYDLFLEQQKVELAEKKLMNQEDIVTMRRNEQDIFLAEQELWNVQEAFKANMEAINNELNLVRQHYSMLEEQLGILETDGSAQVLELKRRRPDKQDETPQKDRINLEEIRSLSIDPADYVEEENSSDPYIPHERVFSKYSVMLYYSQDGGQNFFIHQDCKYCESCEEKTIACPHKVIGESKVILLPHKVTHIKIRRPAIKITRDILDRDTKLAATAGSVVGILSGAGVSMRSSKAQRFTESAVSARASPAPFSRASASSTVIQFKNPLQRVWDDYKTRTDMIRTITRPVSLERTKSLLEQFYCYIAWQDEFASEEDGYGSVLDNLYEFFGNRYLKEEAKYAAAHDFLSSVLLYSRDHKELQVFAHCLAGNMDFAICRYITCLNDFIEETSWLDVEDFRSFSAVIYPFIQDEDLESLQMGYVSFSENRISKLHVQDYILYMMLKGREPRIQEMEHQLMQYPSKEQGLMSEEEFIEALDHVLQLTNEHMCRTLFSETLLLQRATDPDSLLVHVSKLSYILAYMQFLEHRIKIKDSIHLIIEENRPKHEEALGVHGHVVKVDPKVHLMTMSGIQNLSFNIAKRDNSRKDRLQMEADML